MRTVGLTVGWILATSPPSLAVDQKAEARRANTATLSGEVSEKRGHSFSRYSQPSSVLSCPGGGMRCHGFRGLDYRVQV